MKIILTWIISNPNCFLLKLALKMYLRLYQALLNDKVRLSTLMALCFQFLFCFCFYRNHILHDKDFFLIFLFFLIHRSLMKAEIQPYTSLVWIRDRVKQYLTVLIERSVNPQEIKNESCREPCKSPFLYNRPAKPPACFCARLNKHGMHLIKTICTQEVRA